jgi:hypothetical protein
LQALDKLRNSDERVEIPRCLKFFGTFHNVKNIIIKKTCGRQRASAGVSGRQRASAGVSGSTVIKTNLKRLSGQTQNYYY